MGRTSARHRVTDIATQSGLSRATVDRVLHEREGVRPETVAQVERAMAELDRQHSQIVLSGTSLIFDLVMQSPIRFASATRTALERELSSMRPAVLRARSQLQEQVDPVAAVAQLEPIAHRGSDGVILKAPDHPAVVAAVDRLVEAGIPVVTFTSDISGSRRAAHVGLQDRSAGATAAYLITQWAGREGGVLVTMTSTLSRNEEQRHVGFRETLAELAPARTVHEVTDTDGLDPSMLSGVRALLTLHPLIDAVYSPGGGNLATVAAFDELGHAPSVFIAHDLDRDNQRLLRQRRISAVLHHDLRADMRRACRLLLQARGVLPGAPATVPSQVQVVTPYNEPSGLILEPDDD